MVEEAFSAAFDWTVKDGARVFIMPHHLVAAREIASLVKAIPAPSVVYLLSPDHFSRGKTVFTRSDHPDIVNGDHGVTNLLPFFAKAWPDARIVPILVRRDATETNRASMADELVAHLTEDPSAIVVVSVDFSHYLPAEVADFHDVLAEDVIASLADLEADRVEIDSPGALAIGLKVARAFGLGDVTIHAHTNSLRILQATIAQESTSHFLVSFAPGEIRKQNNLSILFFGDLMFDRTVRDRMTAAKSLEYPFAKIRGQEDRFFWGQDLVVANLEGPVTAVRRQPDKEIDFAFDPKIVGVLKKLKIDAVSQANNHSLDQGRAGATESRQLLESGGVAAFGDEVRDDATSSMTILERRGRKIALLGFNTTDNPLDKTEAEKSIEIAKQKAGVVIVFMHWGEEYHDTPSQSQIDLAHWFIDRGVDAVIGSHPHWMQSVEIYKNHPIAYSLGNFIFDQDWSAETRLGLAVGFVLNGEGSAFHLFPVKIVASQPELLTGAERRTRLAKLAEISDPALAQQIKSGVIYISK